MVLVLPSTGRGLTGERRIEKPFFPFPRRYFLLEITVDETLEPLAGLFSTPVPFFSYTHMCACAHIHLSYVHL